VSAPARTWLRNALLADGRHVDVALDGPLIGAVVPAGTSPAAEPGDDLSGMLLVTAPAEPHAHLDKVYTSSLVPNPKGDLLGAIEGWMGFLPQLTRQGMAERATRAALDHLAHGATAIRTHVNVHDEIGLRAVEALLEVRSAIGHLIDIQIVALVGWTTGDNGATNRRLLRDAVLADPCVLVGGVPHLDTHPFAASDISLDLAGEHGRDIDLHTDETLDPAHLELRYLAERVLATGYTGTATASHCCSLAMQDPAVQADVSAVVAEAGVSVVALPQTNLFLQARDHSSAHPRGITAVRPLLGAGANVAAGADNVRDPFNSMGRSDPLETAALMVMAGHLLPHEAWTAVTDGSRRAMAMPVVRIEAGSPAELLAMPAPSLADAIAAAGEARVVWHRGRVVARTTVTSQIG
jgi:cytosine/creatinine deaminase